MSKFFDGLIFDEPGSVAESSLPADRVKPKLIVIERHDRRENARAIIILGTKLLAEGPIYSDVYIADRTGRTRQLTQSIELAMRPASSPDGRHLAFDSNGAIFLAEVKWGVARS